jgi:hypothetical protein
MIAAEHYRTEARRCRSVAAVSEDIEVAAAWIRMAIDYEQLAARPDSLSAPGEFQLIPSFRT